MHQRLVSDMAFTEDKKILDMGFIDIKKEKTPKDKVQKA